MEKLGQQCTFNPCRTTLLFFHMSPALTYYTAGSTIHVTMIALAPPPAPPEPAA